MKRIIQMLVVLALVAAACGGNDEGTDTTTADTTAATTADTTATTAAAATTEAPATTVAAVSQAEAFIAASAERVGEYEGQWDNATFGSSGALYINVLEANPGTINNVLIQVDVDGFAFGAEDPELFVIEMWVEGDELATGFSNFLGDFTFETSPDGSFTVSANPPLLAGMTLEIDGVIDGDGFGGTYEIPGLADGTWSAAPVG